RRARQRGAAAAFPCHCTPSQRPGLAETGVGRGDGARLRPARARAPACRLARQALAREMNAQCAGSGGAAAEAWAGNASMAATRFFTAFWTFSKARTSI